MVYFGVDEYDDPLLTYYECTDGNCTEIYDMKCTRTCDAREFDFNRANIALLQVTKPGNTWFCCCNKSRQKMSGFFLDMCPNNIIYCFNNNYTAEGENPNGSMWGIKITNGSWDGSSS